MRSSLTLAGALLAAATLTTVAGLAGGAADAAHPARRAGVAASAATLEITVTSTKSSTTMSTTQFTPGNTVFDLEGKGGLEIVSLKSGFTINHLFEDA